MQESSSRSRWVLRPPPSVDTSSYPRYREDSESPTTRLPYPRVPWSGIREISPDRLKVYPDPPKRDAPMMTMYDVTITPIPSEPPVYDEGKLRGTRGPTNADYNLRGDLLEEVVPFRPLVEQLEGPGKQLLSKITPIRPNEHGGFLAKIHPGWTALGLPPVVKSEHDSADWALGVIIRPVLAMIRQLSVGGDLTFDRSHRTKEHPSVSSCEAADCVPDGIVTNDNGEGCLLLEHKTSAALRWGDGGTFADITMAWDSMPLGRAARFKWPRKGDKLTKPRDKILVQVWTQMVKKRVSYSILSSYQMTIFFVKQGSTLFMSPRYTRVNPVLFLTFCFIALATGHISKKTMFELPKVDRDWCQSPPSQVPGLDPATLPQSYAGERVRRTHSERWIKEQSPPAL